MQTIDDYGPRPAGIDSETGVWVLLEFADDAVLWSWLANQTTAKLVFAGGAKPPAVVAEFHVRCVDEMLRAGRGEFSPCELAALDACWRRLRAAGYATLVGRYGLWSVLALVPDCPTPCLVRVPIDADEAHDPRPRGAG